MRVDLLIAAGLPGFVNNTGVAACLLDAVRAPKTEDQPSFYRAVSVSARSMPSSALPGRKLKCESFRRQCARHDPHVSVVV